MDKLMRRAIALAIMCLIILSAAAVLPYTCTASAESKGAYVLHDGVKLYADDTLSAVVAELEQNAELSVIESVNIGGVPYYKVQCGAIGGYVKSEYVYFANFYRPELKIKSAICLSDKVGAKVNIYAAPDLHSEVIYTLDDGTRLEVADCPIDGFYGIISDERGGYIMDENLTSGLSRNYRVALAIGCVCIVIIVAVVILIYVRRNKEYIEAHKANRIAAKKKVVEEEEL